MDLGMSYKLPNSYFNQTLEKTLCANHRVIIAGYSDWGQFFYVPVGALNVGRIVLTKQNTEYENNYNSESIRFNNTTVDYEKKEEVGYFVFGSTIAMIFQAPSDRKFLIEKHQHITLFQPLLS
ncbi:hypothetical protein HZS_2461 [Henneguya salminicola]|uniref:Phosphatidylserine decarboxylase proenzyme, mitochondrial (Trinotate prediction) n=1 Tax=Henneguya salminicola TaxID=69463 RepID=A0A6G3MJQ2_HENSL|nr:hypothetical protein HZS_2461 [Henneguya salminicola]